MTVKKSLYVHAVVTTLKNIQLAECENLHRYGEALSINHVDKLTNYVIGAYVYKNHLHLQLNNSCALLATSFISFPLIPGNLQSFIELQSMLQ